VIVAAIAAAATAAATSMIAAIAAFEEHVELEDGDIARYHEAVYGDVLEQEEQTNEKKKRIKKVMMDITGTQQQFFDHYVEKMEVGLAHSWRCKWTNAVMKRRYSKRENEEMTIETDFSALFEFRPGDAECCKFYKNCSILPLIIHYTDAQDHRRKDAVIVCSDDLGSNFKVHKHCMQKVLSAYLPRYCT